MASTMWKPSTVGTTSCVNLSVPNVSIGGGKLVSFISHHAYTLLLFTWTDYKTIFFPVTAFACAAAPLHSAHNLFRGCFWIWIHLLMCNVSNQCRSKDEDTINRPWRPVSSGRISSREAVVLRWILVLFCLSWSAWHHNALALSTLSLVTTTFFYDELELARHPIGKNFCNIGGYMSFEAGATMIMGPYHRLDDISLTAVILSGMIIFTTIQTQDFPDIEGDSATGRITLPLYAPEFSRVFTLLAITFWSAFLNWIWRVPSPLSNLFELLGFIVGLRYYRYRKIDTDKRSYLIYNAWLAVAHILPHYARSSLVAKEASVSMYDSEAII